MPPRRNPRRSAGKPDTKSNPATPTIDDYAATAADAASATVSRTTRATRTRKYEATPVPRQITFPPRRKIVRKYGGRRSLPAQLKEEEVEEEKEEGEAAVSKRSLKQQTLTQIDYVRSSSELEQGARLETRRWSNIRNRHEEEEEQKW
ncbi:hypothetical protein VTH06DRAFT_7701 [Thermothelomyces fergusii]